MTGAQCISSFLLLYDYLSSGNAPGYRTDDIISLLNNAQNDFIKMRMFGKNFQPPAFEQNQKRVADLQTLIVIPTGLTQAPVSTIATEKIYSLPTNFLYYIDSISQLTRSNYPLITSVRWLKNKVINHEDVTKFINSEINRTHFLYPVAWIEAGFLKVMGDRYTTITNGNNYTKLSYIKKPTAIANTSMTPDFPESVHQEIVEIAVKKGLQVIGDPRWQTASLEEQQKTE